MFKPRMDILPLAQQRLWPELRAAAPQRAEAKDYRDIAAMVSAGVSLSKGLSAARELYGLNFQPSESLKAMVFFDDGDLATLTKAEKSCLVNAVSAVRDLPRVEIVSRQLAAR